MKKILLTGMCFVVGWSVFFACKEDSGKIGLQLQSDDEFLNTDYFDTTSIIAYSAIHDSLITSNLEVNMLGYLNDPVFGKTQAGIYSQLLLSSFGVDFGNNVVVDSAVLTLVYAGYYGDTLNSFKINVYELDENIINTQKYYTTSSLKNKGIALTENPNLYISPRPTTKTDTSISTYCLSIRLKKEFAKDKFISQSGSNVYADSNRFLDYFKGLYVEASDLTGNGCLLSINMKDPMSKLTIYYKNSDGLNRTYWFNMNESTLHFGVFNHFNYANAVPNLREQLNGKETSTSGKDVLYAQAGTGIKVSLHFPNLKEMFKDKKVIIHRAALVISQKDDALPNYFPPNALFCTYKKYASDSTAYFLPDYSDLGGDYFGGKYNPTKKEYYFNITKYIQNMVDGRGDDYLLSLFVNPSVTYFSRLMIYGTAPTIDFDKRLKLKINYTIVH